MNTHEAHHRLLLIVFAVFAIQIPCKAAPLPATHVEQTGKPLEGAAAPGIVVLANEPDGKAGLLLDFDLESVTESVTPEARLQLGEVERLKVQRPGQQSSPERDVMMVFYESGGQSKLAGSLPTKAGGTINSYTIEVTRAVNATLSKPAGQRKLRLELRLEGKPVFFEVYGVSDGTLKPPVTLEIAPSKGWTDDWEKRLEPVSNASRVYKESCLPMIDSRDKEVALNLLYPAKKIIEVSHPASGEIYEEGRDWVLRDGKLILPVGTRVPIQIESEFFTEEKKDKDGNVKTIHGTIRLVPGTWYHDRQIAVSYEPAARDWSFAPPISTLDQMPRLKKMLAAKKPVKVVLFGDSISAGGDCSALHFVPPYQPNFGELVTRKLEKHYGSEIIFINPSRGGATSEYAAKQAEAQVAWFKPDLAIVAYGMNDRADKRIGSYRANMESILDTIRAKSPETEFLVVTPMLNSPKQPGGNEPVKTIRDEALKISRPGTAFADITTSELDMLKRKDYLDLSGNGANHPNDFLHRIYAQRILEVLIPPKK